MDLVWAPRVMISQDALKATALIQTGSRIQERYRLSISDSTSLEPLMGELRGRLSQEGAQVTSFRDAQPRLRRFLDQLNLYLGLIGFTILLVGGIGVACTIQGFLTQKIPIIATLKTLGADSSQIIRLYLTQSLILGGIGSLLGVIVGVVLHRGLPLLLQGIIPETMPMNPTVAPILRGDPSWHPCHTCLLTLASVGHSSCLAGIGVSTSGGPLPRHGQHPIQTNPMADHP